MFAEHQQRHHGALYFWKSRDWAAEFEYRWVLLDSGTEDVLIEIGDCLAGIIVGDRFPPATVDMIANTLTGRDISIARLHYRNGHPIILPWQDYSAG